MVQQNEFAQLPYFSSDSSLHEASIEADGQLALKLIDDTYINRSGQFNNDQKAMVGDSFSVVANNQLSLINVIDKTTKSLAQNPDINFLKELLQYLLKEIIGVDILNKNFSIPANRVAGNSGWKFLNTGDELAASSIQASRAQNEVTRDDFYESLKKFPEAKNFVGQIVQAISKNEGDFTAINFNDAGYGISVGIRQWNQKVGELPLLLKSWYKNNPETFERIFGEDYASKLLNESWVRSYNMSGDFNLMERMKVALADKDYQKVQLDLACAFVSNGIKLACNYGFSSQLGIALVCDMVNQMGYFGAIKALQKAGLCQGAVINNERKAIEKLSTMALRPQAANRYLTLVKVFNA